MGDGLAGNADTVVVQFSKLVTDFVGIFVDGYGWSAGVVIEFCHFNALIYWYPFLMKDGFHGVEVL